MWHDGSPNPTGNSSLSAQGSNVAGREREREREGHINERTAWRKVGKGMVNSSENKGNSCPYEKEQMCLKHLWERGTQVSLCAASLNIAQCVQGA